MIIKELNFPVFCKVFKEHDDMVIGIGFTKHGTANVLLTPAVTWYVARNAETGKVTLWSEESEEDKSHTFVLNVDDFDEIVIC